MKGEKTMKDQKLEERFLIPFSGWPVQTSRGLGSHGSCGFSSRNNRPILSSISTLLRIAGISG